MQASVQSSMAELAEGGSVAASKPGSTAQKLSTRIKLLYGTGQFVEATTTTALTYLAFFYLTAVCGLSGTLAGASAFIALTVDSVADPAIGLLSDNTRSRLGRRHLYMFAALVPIVVSLALFFSIPAGFSGVGLFVYATAVTIVLRIALSFYILPYIALGAELSENYEERSVIVAYRVLIAMVANFLCFGLAFGVFLNGANGLLDRAAYAPFGLTAAAIVLVGGFIGAAGTKSFIPRLHVAAERSGSIVRQFLRELGEIFRNRSFVALFLGALIFFVAQGAAAALTLHANKYFWHLPADIVQGVVYGLALGPVVGIPLTSLMLRYVEKRTVAVVGLLIFCASQFLMPVLEIEGVLPKQGTVLFVILITNAAILGAALTAGVIAFQSMMADASDEHEHLFGTRREALFYAGLTLSAKSAGGLGAFVAGVAMDAIHFPSNLASKGQTLHLAPDVVRNLGLISGPLPALLTAVGVLMILAYRLDRVKHAAIRSALDARYKTKA